MWSAEKRAEGLEYMHPKPSSHSGRIVGNTSPIRLGKVARHPREAVVLRPILHAQKTLR